MIKIGELFNPPRKILRIAKAPWLRIEAIAPWLFVLSMIVSEKSVPTYRVGRPEGMLFRIML